MYFSGMASGISPWNDSGLYNTPGSQVNNTAIYHDEIRFRKIFFETSY